MSAITLRPFQERALQEYRVNCAKTGFGKLGAKLGIAPTAFGKSIVMGYLAGQLCPKGWRVIILAHREALVTQNADKVRRVAPTLNVGVEIGKDKASGDCDVISASIATLKGERALLCINRWREDGRKILLCTDEAHHALADSYLHFFSLLNPDEHLGLTATPFRGDGESLSVIYPLVGFDVKRGEMIDDGWLARPRHFKVESTVSLASVRSRAGDYIEKDLVKTLDVKDRNDLIIAAANDGADYLRLELGLPVARAVCFALNVEHCYTMAESFKKAGWRAFPIEGATPIPDRRAADQALREATQNTVLISCGVLTEGWDVEEVNLGLFARPTKSPVLADQMLGRVLRWMEQKPDALVIDFADLHANDRVTIAQSFRLPREWTADGRCLRADERWFGEQLAKVSIRLASALWGCTNRGDVEAMLAHPETAKVKRLEGRDYLWWALGDEARMVVDQGTVVLSHTPQGDLVAEWRCGLDRRELSRDFSMGKVCHDAELWVDTTFPQHGFYLRQKESYELASEKQIEFLKRKGIPHDPTGITKHEAGNLINESKMMANKELEAGIVTFGKHKGKHVGEVPTGWLKFMLYDVSMGWLKGRPEYALFSTELSKRSAGL